MCGQDGVVNDLDPSCYESENARSRRLLLGIGGLVLATMVIWTVTIPAFELLIQIRPTFSPFIAYALRLILLSPANALLSLVVTLPILLPIRLTFRIVLVLALLVIMFLPGAVLAVALHSRADDWPMFILQSYAYYYFAALYAVPVISGVVFMGIVTQMIGGQRYYLASDSMHAAPKFTIVALMELTCIVALALTASRNLKDPAFAEKDYGYWTGGFTPEFFGVIGLFLGWLIYDWIQIVLGNRLPRRVPRSILLIAICSQLMATMIFLPLMREFGTSRLSSILLSSIFGGVVAGSLFSFAVLAGVGWLRHCGFRLAQSHLRG